MTELLQILDDPTKGTDAMRESLRGLQAALTCPLCEDLFEDPVTFAVCGHSFCRECVDSYACDNWKCPVPECGMPFALQGKGSYTRIDSALRTSMDSFTTICQSLQRAKPYWWKDDDTLPAGSTNTNQEAGEVIDLMADANDHTNSHNNNNNSQDDGSSRNENTSLMDNNNSLSEGNEGFLSAQEEEEEEEEMFETAQE